MTSFSKLFTFLLANAGIASFLAMTRWENRFFKKISAFGGIS
jgi:hypothetical protein